MRETKCWVMLVLIFKINDSLRHVVPTTMVKFQKIREISSG